MSFRPAFWLKNPHLQTFWPFLFRSKKNPGYQRERIRLPDSDFIDLDWLRRPAADKPKATVVLLHGLQGCSHSHYILGLARSLYRARYQVVAMNLRGRSGQVNRKPVFYHAGYSTDLDAVIHKVKEECNKINVVAVSLGGSILLNWLAQTPNANKLINQAVAVSVPYLLASCAMKMQTGFSKIYQYYLLRSLKESTREKIKTMDIPGIQPNWPRSKSFFEFDNAVTSRLHGFKDVDDYYRTASTRHKLADISNPLLLIQAADDPFMFPNVIPDEQQLHRNTRLEVYQHGGHAGFVSARGLTPRYWLEDRILTFFEHGR